MGKYRKLAELILASVLGWLSLTAVLLLLPGKVSIVCLFAAHVLFLIGAKLHYKLPTAVGGIRMFSGVFAAALLGAPG